MGDEVFSNEGTSVIPLLVGAIGPRDLSDIQAACVAKATGDVLAGMSRTHPDSDVVIVTSVAAGTDTVVAQTANNLGYPVFALLPLAVDDYAQDFAGDGESLSDRLALTQGSWVVPSIEVSGRDARYQACGRLLAAISSTLLVAWNGTPPRKPGGTSDTLFYAVPEVAALPDLSGGPSTLATERGEVVTFPPGEPDAIKAMGTGMSARPWVPGNDPVSRRIDRFNRDSGPRPKGSSFILAIQVAADNLASQLQRRYRRWTSFILVLGVLTIVSVDVQAELSRAWFLWIQFLALIVLLSMWWAMNRWGGKRRFEEYRALAEGARVQEAWRKAGIDVPVADHYLQPLGPEGFWIRRALRTVWFIDLVQSTGASRADLESARTWIDGQIRYFEGTAGRPGAIRRNEAKARQMRLLAWAFVVVALLGLLPDIATLLFGAPVNSAVSTAARLAWGLGGAAAAATVAYSQLMGYSRAAKRGQLSLEMYQQALMDFESARASYEVQQRIVLDTGKEALRETGDWLVMNTSQTLRPV